MSRSRRSLTRFSLSILAGAAAGIALGWVLRGSAAAPVDASREPGSAASSGPPQKLPDKTKDRAATAAAETAEEALLPLLRLLCTADAADAPGMPRLLLAARNTRGVVPFLAQHWAELDAPHMFRVLRSESGSRPLSGDAAVTKALFDTWLTTDKEAAIAALDDGDALPNMERLRSSIVRYLLHKEPERGLQQIAKWRLNLHYNDMDGIAAWAARDPAAAANASAKVPLRGVSEHLLIEVAKVWRDTDPVAVMRWAVDYAKQHPDSPVPGIVSHIARLEWGEYDGAKAKAFAGTITDPAIRIRLNLDP